jgi:hypothetical protein
VFLNGVFGEAQTEGARAQSRGGSGTKESDHVSIFLCFFVVVFFLGRRRKREKEKKRPNKTRPVVVM